MTAEKISAEKARLQENRDRTKYWTRWGSFVSERQWGTVREDYSADGSVWEYFDHSDALHRAYRWGEDGIAGICDNHQRLCFGLAVWNEADPHIKERLFGLSNKQGNHGEDVKEYYFYLDNTPTHAYMKYLYKYPQAAFPYQQLLSVNKSRSTQDPEFELMDTGVFERDRYFDIFVEYAKHDDEDMAVKITAHNRGDEEKPLHLLPTLWFRNTWSWEEDAARPVLKAHTQKDDSQKGDSRKSRYSVVAAEHESLGDRWLYCAGEPQELFTENETNKQLLFGTKNRSSYVKDGINSYVVAGKQDAVNPDKTGTKFSAQYRLSIPPGESRSVMLRLCDTGSLSDPFGEDTATLFELRKQEADEFYSEFTSDCYQKNQTGSAQDEDKENVRRQAFAGMLWNKQFYHYVVREWLSGDPAQPAPPEGHATSRNVDWTHLFNDDIISMPDTWEYPWYASWDWAFHLVPLAVIDPDFAKLQLSRLTREWYMHPNGQIPAYEWDFNGVTPPIQAWCAWQIYQIEKKYWGREDKDFLERIFQKLLMNFTWWVNQKDAEGRNLFQGGFLGMDNIGVFDRSSVPTEGTLEQADGTSWMAVYCLGMLTIALELAVDRPPYEDTASKFFEHFLYIADAMNQEGAALWDEEDGFFYDAVRFSDDNRQQLKVRSLVGLIPLLAVVSISAETIEKLPNFKGRLQWFINNRLDLRKNVACMESEGVGERRLLALCYATERADGEKNKLRRLLEYMLDEREFLGPHGIRSVSKYHEKHPFTTEADGEEYSVAYEPAESTSNMFGGNSNWRGPVWFPINYLLIEALRSFHGYLGDDFKVAFPTGSKEERTLAEVAVLLSDRLVSIFLKDETGHRPVFGQIEKFQNDPHWRDYILFYEYFNGDDGAGLGASHQTGWTGLAAYMIQQCSEFRVDSNI